MKNKKVKASESGQMKNKRMKTHEFLFVLKLGDIIKYKGHIHRVVDFDRTAEKINFGSGKWVHFREVELIK